MARILIVEPHADLRTLLDLVVRRLGHEPVVQRHGEDDPADLDAGVIEVGDGYGLLAARRLRELGCPVVLMGSSRPTMRRAPSLPPPTWSSRSRCTGWSAQSRRCFPSSRKAVGNV